MIKGTTINFFSDMYSVDAKERPFIDNLFSNRLGEESGSSIESFFFFLEEEVKDPIFSMDKDKFLG